MTEELQLGRPVPPEMERVRDAVHVAVVPVVADVELEPGTHVALVSGARDRVEPSHESIGIVDPFLAHPAREGQRVWMLLYPGTITSLRHAWSHPDFDEIPPHGDER